MFVLCCALQGLLQSRVLLRLQGRLVLALVQALVLVQLCAFLPAPQLLRMLLQPLRPLPWSLLPMLMSQLSQRP